MDFAWRILYRFYRLSSWMGYAGKRRFTRAGWMVLLAVGLTALMGPDTENSVAYQGFTLLLFLLAVAIASSWSFRARFSATRELSRFGTVGSPLIYKVLIRNLTSKRQSGLTLLDDLADPRPSFQEWRAMKIAEEKRVRSFRFSQRQRAKPFRPANLKEAAISPMLPGQEVMVRLEMTPLRRGILRFAGATVACSDPLGLYRSTTRIALPQIALILPKRYPLPPVPLPGALKYQEGGVALASNVGQSEEFVALRDYRHGDPLRHIHWRSWAKVGKPVVKELEDEFFVRHALVLDTFIDDPQSELFEEAVSVAASFAASILTQESLLDLLFVGEQSFCFTAGRGLAHSDRMLEILAAVKACHDHTFSVLEHLVLNHVSVVSGCICVLLAWDQPRRSFVQKLKELSVPLLVLVMVGRGETKSMHAGPMQDEPDHFHVLEAGQVEQGLAKLK